MILIFGEFQFNFLLLQLFDINVDLFLVLEVVKVIYFLKIGKVLGFDFIIVEML